MLNRCLSFIEFQELSYIQKPIEKQSQRYREFMAMKFTTNRHLDNSWYVCHFQTDERSELPSYVSLVQVKNREKSSLIVFRSHEMVFRDIVDKTMT